MIKFKLEWISKINGTKYAELKLEDGRRITYIYVPSEVRYALGSIKKFFESEYGQKEIERYIKNNFKENN